MAACLITVSGTSGEVRVNYKISGNDRSNIASIGTFYIEDTATNVTWTNLSGDATASSSCLTITNLPLICYKINWKGIVADGYKFDALILGNSTLAIDDTFPKPKNFPDMINTLGDYRVQVVQYKVGVSGFDPDVSMVGQVEYSYILKVFGTSVPFLRVKNKDNTGHIYLHGTVSSCNVAGYTDVVVCTPEFAP